MRAPRATGIVPTTPLPVSVIVPARNEAEKLPALLRSLASLERAPAQLIVVDDQSTDATATLAATAGAIVVGSPGPPAGWTGKNHACHLGARAATQPWLLFLDADVTLGPSAVATTLDHSRRHGLDGVSLFPQQQCRTLLGNACCCPTPLRTISSESGPTRRWPTVSSS